MEWGEKTQRDGESGIDREKKGRDQQIDKEGKRQR